MEYKDDVIAGEFPDDSHSYHLKTEVIKELKKRMFRVLDSHGKLRKESYTRYIDEALFKDFLRLCRWYRKVSRNRLET